jgi:hypothetical protein
MTLDPDESINLDSRVDGGPVVTRDQHATDVLTFDEAYASLDKDEIRQLAEAAGLEVSD